MDMIDAYCDRTEATHRREEQLLSTLTYVGAKLTGYSFNDPKRFPRMEDVFPSFADEKQEPPPEQWKREQLGFAAWVAAYNDRLKRGEQHGSKNGRN